MARKKDKKDRKKLKDTAIGQMLKEKAPAVLNVVGDLLPDAGVPGVIKNAIDTFVPDPKEKEALKTEVDNMTIEFLKDVQDARSMYENTDHKKADEIATGVIKWNLWIILALVAVMVCTIVFLDGKVAAVISGIVGTAIGNLFQERNTVIGFFFGSSQGSKDKDNF